MDVVHFTELREYAVKSRVERGRTYIYCHPMIGAFAEDWYPAYVGETPTPPTAQAYVLLALSPLIVTSPAEVYGFKEQTNKVVGWWATSGRRNFFDSTRYAKQFHFASDSGVIDGWNNGNFILDRAEMLKRGIRVDMTTKVLETA